MPLAAVPKSGCADLHLARLPCYAFHKQQPNKNKGEILIKLLTCIMDDSSHLAFSAASRRRCTASLSLVRSMPWRIHKAKYGRALVPE